MNRGWLFPALLALVLYGFWGFFPKLAVRHIHPMSAVFWEAMGGALVGIVVLFMLGGRPESVPAGVFYGAATGVVGMLGTLFFFSAARSGPISVVASVTALYPLVTILAAWLLLGETLNLRQMLGVGLAVTAIVLLTTS